MSCWAFCCLPINDPILLILLDMSLKLVKFPNTKTGIPRFSICRIVSTRLNEVIMTKSGLDLTNASRECPIPTSN